jgi:hypothetical protein
MEEYAFNKDEVRTDVLSNRHNHITTTYYLLLKSKVKRGMSSVADISGKEFYDYIKYPENLLSFYNHDIEAVVKARGTIKKKASEIRLDSPPKNKLEEKESDGGLKHIETMPNSINTKLSGKEDLKISNKKITDRNNHNNSTNTSYINTEIIDKMHTDIKKLPNISYNLKTEPAGEKKTIKKEKFKKIPIFLQFKDDAARTMTEQNKIKKKRYNNEFKSGYVNTSYSFDIGVDNKNITVDQGMFKKLDIDKPQKSPRVNFKTTKTEKL